jgi:type III pantothenate kinase
VYIVTDLTLLIDMGNTRLKWVWAAGGEIDQSTFGRGSRDEFPARCKPPGSARPGRVLISSVADQSSTSGVVSTCEERWRAPVKRLQTLRCQDGIINAYENPATLGIDRWLAIVGAAHAYGTPVVIMDLGTATTLDAVDEQGRHLGGLILPGPALMLESLATATAMPVPAGFGDGETANGTKGKKAAGPGVGPATSTSEAIREGVLAAQIGALNQFMRHVGAKLSKEPQLVLTGGAAECILDRLESQPVFDPWLVFKGMLRDQEL